MRPEESEDDRAERRRARRREGKVNESYTGPTYQGTGPAQSSGNYTYDTDLGKFADPNYIYDPNDEMSSPGAKPPEDSPEFPAWKAHARAWRRFIGQQQSYQDMMLSMGYSPDDIGIQNIKEHGQAGYRRREALGGGDINNYVSMLQSQQQGRFGNVMREGGESNGIRMNSYGIYEDPRPDGSIDYYDSYGAKTDAMGKRVGGSYTYSGQGKNIVNRTSPFMEEKIGHATDNGIAPNPNFNPIGARTFGNPTGTNFPRTQQPTPAPPSTPAPTNSFAYGEPDPGSTYRPFKKQDTGAAYGSWGSYYGAARPLAGGRTQARRF